MSNTTQVESLLKRYIQHKSGNAVPEACWRIGRSPVAGKGVFATRKIYAGEEIFTDYPLLYGPKSMSLVEPLCSACYNSKEQLIPCSSGCGLPVCSINCERSTSHRKDCNIIHNWIKKNNVDKFTEWSYDILRALTPIRSLCLTKEELELVDCLQQNNNSQHGFEIDLLKKHGLFLNSEQEEIIRKVCYALDTNAFTMLAMSDDVVNLRGLYPLSAAMNHTCSPNTTHVFDNEHKMIVRAAKEIAENEEVTTSYVNLLWSTPLRRQFLVKTKHFSCECTRCLDPTEFGSNLSGLKCKHFECEGIVLPKYSTDAKSHWECNRCHSIMSPRQVGVIQSVLGSIISSLQNDPTPKLIELVREKLPNAVPDCSHICIEFKCRLLWTLGYTVGYNWHELSNDLLTFKTQVCEEILNLLNTLKLGKCKLRGFVLRELGMTFKEMGRRSISNLIVKEYEEKQKKYEQESMIILKNHVIEVRCK